MTGITLACQSEEVADSKGACRGPERVRAVELGERNADGKTQNEHQEMTFVHGSDCKRLGMSGENNNYTHDSGLARSGFRRNHGSTGC